MGKKLQFRRGLEEDLPTLLEGEPGYSVDTHRLYIGNQKTEPTAFLDKEAINDLQNAYREEQENIDAAQDKRIAWLEAHSNPNTTPSATDSNYITMANGYSIEQYATGQMLTNAQEFISEEGNAIVIENIQQYSKVVGMEIRGNTLIYKRAKDSTDEWVKVPTNEEKDTETYDYKLNSTQAVFDVDGIKYSYYEPTIVGTTDGLMPTDDALPILYEDDILDRATKTITFSNETTKVLTTSEYNAYKKYEKVISLCYESEKIQQLTNGESIWVNASQKLLLNDSLEWYIDSKRSETIRFGTRHSFIKNDAVFKATYLIKKNDDWDVDTIGIENGVRDLCVSVFKSELESEDVDGFLKWLESKNIEILIEVEPITIHIDKSLMPTLPLLRNQINISSDAMVAPSSFKITVPVDKISKLEQQISELENMVSALNISH